MSEIKWIKILTDTFDDQKMKLIQKMPEGDAITVIWLKLLTQAGKTNAGGYVWLQQGIPYTPEMLSVIFDKQLMLVNLALKTFEDFKMIEFDEHGLYITNWEKHQNVDGMEKVKEQTRQRVARHREKQRLLVECNVTGNATVTEGNATDIELDKNKNKKETKRKSNSPKKSPPKIQVAEYVSLTEEEQKKIVDRYGVDGATWMIEKLNNYKGAKGVKYKMDYLVLIDWVKDEWIKRKGASQHAGYGRTTQTNTGASNTSTSPFAGFDQRISSE